MLTTSLMFTEHAVERMARRNIHEADIYYVYEHGTCFIRAGVLHIFLGEKNIPETDKHNSRIARLNGTMVLIDSHDAMTVKTVYRNREAIKKDRRKTKYDSRKSSQASSVNQFTLAA